MQFSSSEPSLRASIAFALRESFIGIEVVAVFEVFDLLAEVQQVFDHQVPEVTFRRLRDLKDQKHPVFLHPHETGVFIHESV